MSPLQTALQLAEEYGYKVFPCRADKAPLTEHGFKDATANRQQIEDWWTEYPDALLGVPTGKVNDLFVLDVDPLGMPWYEEHRDRLKYWRIHETRRSGAHVCYHTNGHKYANSAGQIAPGVDTRGEGGYIIWWPAHGFKAWEDGDDQAEPPPEVTALANPVPAAKANGNGQARAKHKKGERHGALIRYAAHLRHQHVEGAPFEAAVLAWNLENCNPPQDKADVLRIVRDYLAKPEDKELAQAHTDAKQTNLRFIKGLADMTIPEKTALVPGLLFPGAYVFVGRPKIGKSWMLLQLAVAVAEGDTFLGFNCQQGDVLAIFGEDDDARIQKRLRALGVGSIPENIYYVNREELQRLAQEFASRLLFTEWLEDWLSAHSTVKLVLIDTETTVRQTWTGECQSTHLRVTESDYKETRTFDEVALRRQVVLLLVNHASKLRGNQWVDIHELINRSMTAVAGASGSIGIADPPDADPLELDQRLRVFGVRGRDLEHEVLLAIHQEKDVPRFLSDGPYREVVQSHAETDVLEALKECSPDASAEAYVTAGDIGSLCGKSAKTVNKILSRMVKKGRTRWEDFRLTSKTGKGGGYRLDKA